MKIGLVKTYFCNECNRHAYLHDIEFYRSEEASNWATNQDDAIWCEYRCACGYTVRQVRYVIDENNELVPDHDGYRRLW